MKLGALAVDYKLSPLDTEAHVGRMGRRIHLLTYRTGNELPVMRPV